MIVVLFLASTPIAKLLYKKADLGVGLEILAVSVVCQHLGRLFVNAVMASKDMKAQLAILGIIEPVLWFAAIVLTAVVDPTLKTLCIFHALANAVLLVVCFFYFCFAYKVRNLHLWFRDEKIDWNLMKISLPLGFSELTSNILVKLPVFILGRVLPEAEFAPFGIAHQVANAVITLRSSFACIIYPSIGEYSGAEEREDHVIRGRLQQFTIWSLKFIAPFFIILLLFEHQIMRAVNVHDPNVYHFLPYMITGLCIFGVLANTEFVLMMLQRGYVTTALHTAFIVIFGAVYAYVAPHTSLTVVSIIFLIQLILTTVVYTALTLRDSPLIHPFHPLLLLDISVLVILAAGALVFEYLVVPFSVMTPVWTLVSMVSVAGVALAIRGLLKKVPYFQQEVPVVGP
jgi:O-antigen/teichoic acid export membrane protein